MFPREYDYWRSRGSIARSRERLGLNDQRLWSVKESLDQEGVILPNHAVYAQNDAYLEMTNPGWEYQWKYTMAAATVLIFCPPAIWAWYSVAVHPLLFGTIVPFFSSLPYESDMAPLFWGGWLLFFTVAIGAATLLIIFIGLIAYLSKDTPPERWAAKKTIWGTLPTNGRINMRRSARLTKYFSAWRWISHVD